jgi:hypothetical protein
MAIPTETRRLFDDHQSAPYLNVSLSYFRAQVAAGRIPRVELPSVDGHPRTCGDDDDGPQDAVSVRAV